jgi:hypothetical protein
MARTHLIGLRLGTEDDGPTAFEQACSPPGPPTSAASSPAEHRPEPTVLEA